MIPNSRDTLKAYCLRKLGHPVIQVNVADEQVDDRIDEALQMFNEYHFDGKETSYFSHIVTQQDVDNGYLQLPDTIFGVTNIITDKTTGGVFDSGIFNVEFQIHQSDYFSNTGIYSFGAHMTDYYMVKRHIDLMDFMFNGPDNFSFNRKTGKLIIHGKSLAVGMRIMFSGYSLFETDSNGDPIYKNIWNDEWIKKYSVELVRQQWGQNLMKYDGMQLPGGMKFNGLEIFNLASMNIETLENELKQTLQEPAMFFMG